MTIMDFQGKTVVVTGAGSGIGEAAAKLFLARGAEVVAIQNNSPALHASRRVRMNLGDADSIAASLAELPEKIDILCNIAGLGADQGTPERVIGINFIGPRLFTEAILDRIPSDGCVLNTSSSAGRNWRRDIELAKRVADMTRFAEAHEFWSSVTLPHQMSYTLAKEAVVLWTLRMASEHAKFGPRFNVVSPGFTDTPMLRDAFSSSNAAVAALPLDRTRIAAPEEVAEMVVFVCSPAARVLTGADIAADAGLTSIQNRAQFDF